MLICMAVHDTVENGRSEYTERTMGSLFNTVDWSNHRLVAIDNGSCERTKEFLSSGDWYTLITNSENIGTANAINLGMRLRKTGEVVCKTDNDVVWNTPDWADELESAILADESLGILGLKRKDIWQHVKHENPAYRTHFDGALELCEDIMGTCTAFSPKLMDTIGYMNQCSPFYGADDVLYSCRSIIAGFRNAFLPHIDIDHIDEGGTDYTEWKKREAGVYLQEVSIMCKMYKEGKLDVYWGGEFE